jgi:hypothetical protein
MEDTDREREKGTLYRIRKWSVCGDGLKNNSLPHTQEKKNGKPTNQHNKVFQCTSQPASREREGKSPGAIKLLFL